tara:strand:- start:11 stop:265 length:255 start_codon:yes stop_codon:yes gene_type:complete
MNKKPDVRANYRQIFDSKADGLSADEFTEMWFDTAQEMIAEAQQAWRRGEFGAFEANLLNTAIERLCTNQGTIFQKILEETKER